MGRLPPKKDALRALFARSGNQCAFPECTQQVVNNKNQFIGQVCHIEAAMEGGERFNPTSNNEYRRSYENLLLLCYPHHIETDEVDEYPVERLVKIKNKHEKIFKKSDFKINEAALEKLSCEMEKYWGDIERLNTIDHVFAGTGLTMEVNGKKNFLDVMDSAYNGVNGIQNMLEALCASDRELQQDFGVLISKKGIAKKLFDDIPYYENPFVNRNWELHNIGTHNWLIRLGIDLVHIEVKYLEEYMKTNHNDLVAKARFEKTKNILEEYAKTAVHVD